MSLENSKTPPPKKRILSGMRPTGKLHLGNFYGALYNWVGLQKDYECFYFVADWHAMTTEYEDAGNIRDYIPEMLMDWLAAGLDPEKSTLFVQSALPEHAELYLIFGMFTPVPWLERVPTYKDQVQELSHKDLATYGFLGYPVLQAADILMYKAHGVPVGVDQVPHVEMTREIARRFNHFYRHIFPEPEALLTEVPKLTGTDGRKMSKSYNKCIYLSDSKKMLGEALLKNLAPVQGRRHYYENHPEEVREILLAGNARARKTARQTMAEVREAIAINLDFQCWA
ncbi:MAG: tryptophan--tRNA ligase [Syntrophobacterales bacterium]